MTWNSWSHSDSGGLSRFGPIDLCVSVLGPWGVALLGGVTLLEEVCHCAFTVLGLQVGWGPAVF